MELNVAKKLKVGDTIYHKKLVRYNNEPLDFTITENLKTLDHVPEFFYAEIKHGQSTFAYLSNEDKRRMTKQNKWIFPIGEFELTIEKVKEKT